MPLNATIVGTGSARHEIADILRRAGFAVRECRDLPAGRDDAHLVCVVLEHPDQYATESVRTFLAGLAGVRLLCIGGDWCASLLRSREDWPPSIVVERTAFKRRLENELRVLSGELRPLPLTAGLEEIAATNRPAHAPRSARQVTAAVMTDDRAYRETLIAQLREAGYDIQPGAADLVVIDIDPLPRNGDSRGSHDESVRSAKQTVLLTADPASVQHLQGDRRAVASKFAPVTDWLQRVTFAVALLAGLALHGCQARPPEPKAVQNQPDWSEQIRAVQRGDRKTVAVERVPDISGWAALGTGCEQLEILEIEDELPPEVDFRVLGALTSLKRVKLTGLTDEGAAILGRLPALSQVVISSETLTDSGVASLCRLPLVQLRLHAPRVSDAGMAGIGALAQLRFLHFVDVGITDAALPELAKLEALESLYLDGTKCTDEGLSAFLKQRPDLHFHRDQTHLRDDPRSHAH